MRLVTPLRAVVLLVSLAALFAAVPSQRLLADAEDDSVATLKDLEKAGDEDRCVGKLQQMAGDASSGAKSWAAIREVAMKAKKDKIAAAAIKAAAGAKAKDVDFLKWLIGKIENKDLFDRKDGRPEVYKAILEAIVPHGNAYMSKDAPPKLEETLKTARPPLEKVIAKFISGSGDAEYAVLAITAYGSIRDRAVVDQLLKWGEGMEGGGGRSGKKTSPEAREIETKSKAAILEVLGDTLAADAGEMPEWRTWWTEKSKDKTWTFPDPNAPPPPEVEITAELKEYKDVGYGWSVKRPEGPGWAFEKAEFKGPRVTLGYCSPTDAKYRIARAYFSIHDPRKDPPKDIPGLVKWAKTDVFAKQMDMGDREVVEREATFGGAAWTIVTGKGDGKEAKQGWGTMERRFYFAKVGSKFMYIDAFIRMGAEPEAQAAFWKAVEQTVISAKK